MNSQKIINLLTMCRKAGKLVTGFDISIEAIIDGKSKCLLIASNTSPKTLKEINYRIKSEGLEGKVDVLTISLTMDEVAQYISVHAGVIAICDSGFSKAFKKLVI